MAGVPGGLQMLRYFGIDPKTVKGYEPGTVEADPLRNYPGPAPAIVQGAEVVKTITENLYGPIAQIGAAAVTGGVTSNVASFVGQVAQAAKKGASKVAGLQDLFYSNFLGTTTNEISNALMSTVPAPTGGNQSIVGQIIKDIGGLIAPGLPQLEQMGQGGLVTAKGKIRKCKNPIMVPSAPGSSLMIAKCPTRRMNALNPRALRRATSRISAFHRFAVAAEKQMAAAFRKGGFHAPRTRSTRCGTCRKTRCSC